MNPEYTRSAAAAATDRELLTTAFNSFLFSDFGAVETTWNQLEKHIYSRIHSSLQDEDTLVKYIPSAPGQLLELIQELKSENADFDKVMKIIKDDASLLGEVIKTANSPLYRPRSGEITSLDKAISMLGLSGVMQIAMMVMMRKIVDNQHSQFKGLVSKAWGYCLRCAEACQILGGPGKPFDNYLLGLVHDVGRTAVLNCCIAEVDNGHFNIARHHAVVLRLMQDNTARLSTLVAREWGLSNYFINAYNEFEKLRTKQIDNHEYTHRSDAFQLLESGTLCAMIYTLCGSQIILKDDGIEILLDAGISDSQIKRIFSRYELANATLS